MISVIVATHNRRQLLEQTLMQDEVTRQSVMEKAYSLDQVELPLLLDGITVTTNGTEDPFPIESMRINPLLKSILRTFTADRVCVACRVAPLRASACWPIISATTPRPASRISGLRQAGT